MTAANADDADVTLHYVSIALEMQDAGVVPPLDEICRQHPHLIAQVRAALAGASDLASLDRTAQDFAPARQRVLAGRYRLLERIGAGAMGVVYRAMDLELKRIVAVKLLQTELFGGATDEAQARFAREAEVLAALQHRSVVTVFDRGSTDDGVMFLVMELLRGASLAQLLARVPHTEHGDDTQWLATQLGGAAQLDKSWLRQAVAWAADLASGLHAAHVAGVLHRDVKPSNIFIDARGSARLLDFGIAARLAHPTLAEQRQGGLGTPAYMAPEQVDAETPAAPTLDVYGLTATLYQLLTLRPPYLGTPSQVLVSLQRRDPMPAYKVRPGLPRDLQAILDRGMARRPGARYQTAAELEAELRRFLAYQPVLARPRTLCGRAWSRLCRLRAVQVLAAAVVVLLATLAVNSWREHERAVRAQRWRDNWAPLPPNFALSPRLANRVVTDLLERDRIFALLDRAVRDGDDPIPSYLFRATFRLDHGDSAGAAADFAAVGAHAGSEYATALVQRYRALPPHSAGARALDLGGLPPPRTPRDHYLAAFHALRAWASPTSPQQARTLLEVAELADWAPAQELLGFILLLQATQERDPDQALTTFQRVHALAIALEAQLGRRTAPSALLLGAALSGQQRYGEALAVLREGQALSLWSYSMGSNLALVLRRSGQPEAARDILREMIARRPSLQHAYETLTGVYLDLRDYDAARATVAATPYPDDTAGHSERKFQEGIVEFAVALAMQRAGTPCVEQAQRADALFRASGRDCREQRLAAAIAADDLDAQMRLVLEILEREPLDPDWLQNLEATLPPILDADLTQRLRALVAAQIEAARRLRGADAKPPKPPTTPQGNPNR